MKPKSRFLVIGLDGATFDLILPWMREGKLSNFHKIINEGVHGILKSTTPPISSAAWVSFMTGLNPGKHGVLKFEEYNPNKYYLESDYKPVTSIKYAGKTLFDMVSSYGLKTFCLNVPMTYPAWRINGLMRSGWPFPDNAGTTMYFPQEFNDWEKQFPKYKEINSLERDDFLVKILHNINMRFMQIFDLLKQDWDLFTAVIGDTDHIQHYFWRYMCNSLPVNTPEEKTMFSRAIFEAYSCIDSKLGELLKAVPEETTIIIMSDHGACLGPTKLLQLNQWLRKQGLLDSEKKINFYLAPIKYSIRKIIVNSFNNRARKRLYWEASESDIQKVIKWKTTSAYAFRMWHPFGGIVINLIRRQPTGVINKGKDYEDLREHIINGLKTITDKRNGEKIIVNAIRREDIYSGPYLENVPDIVFEMKQDYQLELGLNYGPLTYYTPERLLYGQNGQHDMNGIFIAWGKNIRKDALVENAHITDVTPTILYGLGLPVAKNIDGKILHDIYNKDFLDSVPINYTDRVFHGCEEISHLKENEVSDIKRKLKNLGYL